MKFCASLKLSKMNLAALVLVLGSALLFSRNHERRVAEAEARDVPPRFTPAPTITPPPHLIGKDDGSARFSNGTAQAGLRYQWSIPGPRPLDILQTIGNGCAFLDYNNDGNLDILLVGTHVALYQGDGHGHFTDVSHATGLDKLVGHFLGCAVGDYDNDGYDDTYISGYRTGVLLHNERGQRFMDVTRQAGLPPQPWGTSCAFADVDGDGRLDLYVANYAVFDPTTSQRLCLDRGHLSSCGPVNYMPYYGILYHNEGSGQFRDMNRSWKVGGPGRNLGVAFADYDHSGHQSVYLSDDENPQVLLQNTGKHFVSVSRKTATSWNSLGLMFGGMGLDWGDYDNDGYPDLFVASFQTEPKCLFHNSGDGLFDNLSDAIGLYPARQYVTFGVKWLDYDNDGWLDLMIANGHVQDNIAEIDKSASYREPTQLFHNDKGKRFIDMSQQAGTALQQPIVGRGLAIGDYDNDGRLDALVVNSEGAPLLLHNESRNAGHWLSLQLIGTKSNRNAYGATVTIKSDELTQTRFCHTDGSYLSASDKRVHIGLGPARMVETLTVRWPSGQVDVLRHVAADRHLVLLEGEAQVHVHEVK